MFEYKLPDQDGKAISHSTENNSLIIIGANGSGKSKLGAWIEQQDMEKVHRVGAQRSLNFGDYIQLKSYEQAENLLFYGQETKEMQKNGRWSWGPNKQMFTTQLLNDYENVLATLIAMKNNQNEAFIKDCRERESRGELHNKTPETIIDVLKRIWQNVFPQRDIDFEDAKVTATLSRDDAQLLCYKGNEMSDGERVGLYLIAQCLCVSKNKTIIIDEPEIHLHRSIMNRIWTEIEKERQDCFFIYITHDTQFAANHHQTKKIWVKNFDGAKWDWQEIQESTLPEQLLLDIMGNRKKVLFVEGTSGSYDTKLYSEIYKDYYVIPCGGCSTVISQVKAMRNTPQLHDLECYGIIDRDYRGDTEIEALKEHDIFTLNVAEVENLFLVGEVLTVANEIRAPQDNKIAEKIQYAIIEDRYKKQKEQQILEAVKAEIKYRLSTIEISGTTDDEAKEALKNVVDSINYASIRNEIESKFNNASVSYKDVLKVFNCKSLTTQASDFFGLKKLEKEDKNAYCDFIIGQLHGNKAEQILNAINHYLPPEIPRQKEAV
jgi:ABC-type cobalamin/Fe3+-siderophores transport system ATPase subunit/ArsR family metal-binding transcriptional regulator